MLATDRALKKRGFGGLNDPDLVKQIAFCVSGHDHLRQILCAVEPDKRTMAYEQMRPYLRFEAKALDVYMAEAADLGARKESQQTPLEIAAEKAIARNMADASKKGVIHLRCSRCTREAAYPGKNAKEATKWAYTDGWMIRRDQAICPACAKLYGKVLPNG